MPHISVNEDFCALNFSPKPAQGSRVACGLKREGLGWDGFGYALTSQFREEHKGRPGGAQEMRWLWVRPAQVAGMRNWEMQRVDGWLPKMASLPWVIYKTAWSPDFSQPLALYNAPEKKK